MTFFVSLFLLLISGVFRRWVFMRWRTSSRTSADLSILISKGRGRCLRSTRPRFDRFLSLSLSPFFFSFLLMLLAHSTLHVKVFTTAIHPPFSKSFINGGFSASLSIKIYTPSLSRIQLNVVLVLCLAPAKVTSALRPAFDASTPPDVTCVAAEVVSAWVCSGVYRKVCYWFLS